jgi:hypothetical protein
MKKLFHVMTDAGTDVLPIEAETDTEAVSIAEKTNHPPRNSASQPFCEMNNQTKGEK